MRPSCGFPRDAVRYRLNPKKRSIPAYEKTTLPLVLCCLSFPAQAAGFYDLPADHWAAEQIQEALDAGVVTGYGGGSFQPGRDITAAPKRKYQAMDACLPVLEGTAAERAYRGLGKVWSHAAMTWLN